MGTAPPNNSQPQFSPQLTRRMLLIGLATGAIGLTLNRCSPPANPLLKIYLLRDSIPSQLLGQFRRYAKALNTEVDLILAPRSNPHDLFELMQAWKQNGSKLTPGPLAWIPSWVPLFGQRGANRLPDWVSLGDYWLPAAIQQGLIEPINLAQFSERLAVEQFPVLKKELTRNSSGLPDPAGQVWGLPYRLGGTVIAYRKDLLAQRQIPPPQDWADLWNPQLKGKISLLDQPREVIGLTLKKQGKSYNTMDLKAVSGLPEALRSLHQQAKFYSSDNYIQPLLLEDTWVAVGWSSDLIPLLKRDPQIAIVTPKSGTALWADVWVRPAGSQGDLQPGSRSWVNFYWQPQVAEQIFQLGNALSPLVPSAFQASSTQPQTPDKPTDKPTDSRLPADATSLNASEFLLPLSAAAREQYETTWRAMRQN
jgi:putative spermidine/putrescine transport system substrate-binding protein